VSLTEDQHAVGEHCTSAQSSRGFGLALRDTALSWRRTINSTSVAANERPSGTNLPASRMKIRYSKRNDTAHDHVSPVGIPIAAGHEPDRLLEPDRSLVQAVRVSYVARLASTSSMCISAQVLRPRIMWCSERPRSVSS
jgi:hypothetical protein